MQYINCKQYSQEILDKVKDIPLKKELWILTMGNDPASQSYVKGKIKDCEYCGIPYSHIKCNNEAALRSFIYAGNSNNHVNGIIVQLPLPKGIDSDLFTDLVTITKDVDGFRENSMFQPCTPEGIIYILEKELGNLSGKRALIIGRGELVGKPLAAMLLDKNCTITVAHSKTTNLDELLEHNDIIVSAVGKPNTVDLSKCKAEIVIDVGVNRNEEGKLCGDCYNFQDTGDGMKVTPVPNGIGLMTRAMLMAHVARVDLNI